jgi:hypothetical protein
LVLLAGCNFAVPAPHGFGDFVLDRDLGNLDYSDGSSHDAKGGDHDDGGGGKGDLAIMMPPPDMAMPPPGLLMLSVAGEPQQDVDLTSDGPVDWEHWGANSLSLTSLDRKLVAPLLSDYTLITMPNSGNGTYTDNPFGFTWSDGTPPTTNQPSATTTGAWAGGVTGAGFSLTCTADTTTRTLKLYIGGVAAKGKLEAALSDSSAPSVMDTSQGDLKNHFYGVYTIKFRAQSSGSQLTIRWTETAQKNNMSNITLQAATLQ